MFYFLWLTLCIVGHCVLFLWKALNGLNLKNVNGNQRSIKEVYLHAVTPADFEKRRIKRKKCWKTQSLESFVPLGSTSSYPPSAGEGGKASSSVGLTLGG